MALRAEPLEARRADDQHADGACLSRRAKRTGSTSHVRQCSQRTAGELGQRNGEHAAGELDHDAVRDGSERGW
jgi:hypothetical protein